MRLIDADALMMFLENKRRVLADTGGNEYALRGFAYCIKRIHEQPTVEAEPVVHGEWNNMAEQNNHLHCKCSICGYWTESYRAIKTYGLSSDDYLEVKWLFCPNCGAKMDGGVSDD